MRNGPAMCGPFYFGLTNEEITMKVLAELREKRNSLAVEMRSLLDNNKDKWNKELQAKYDEFDNALQDVDHQIKSTQRMMDLDAEAKFGIGEGNPTPKQENKVQALYSKWLRHGDKAITAEEWTAIRNTMWHWFLPMSLSNNNLPA